MPSRPPFPKTFLSFTSSTHESEKQKNYGKIASQVLRLVSQHTGLNSTARPLETIDGGDDGRSRATSSDTCHSLIGGLGEYCCSTAIRISVQYLVQVFLLPWAPCDLGTFHLTARRAVYQFCDTSLLPSADSLSIVSAAVQEINVDGHRSPICPPSPSSPLVSYSTGTWEQLGELLLCPPPPGRARAGQLRASHPRRQLREWHEYNPLPISSFGLNIRHLCRSLCFPLLSLIRAPRALLFDINMLFQSLTSHLLCFLLFLRFSTADYQRFFSRPDLVVPRLKVDIYDKERTTPGYLFVAPHHIDKAGGLIFDNEGRLIWTTQNTISGGVLHSFRVCEYKGEDHICFFRGAGGTGDANIYNKHLISAATVKAQNGRAGVDMHEANLVEGGRSMIIILALRRRYDLGPFGVLDTDGWVIDAMFQKIDVETGELLFEWSTVDNIPFNETFIGLGRGGNGRNAGGAWDWTHMNAVDINEDGDYLVSARHTYTLYKVSGKDGHIMWRLGGKTSDFEMGPGVAFGLQHHARWQFSNETMDIVTVFDNSFDASIHVNPRSSGKIIKIEHDTNPPRATLMGIYYGANGTSSSATQGSVQLMPGHVNEEVPNALVGWGAVPIVTEHLPTGEIIYQARLNVSGANLYRAYRYNFTSEPLDHPALHTRSVGPGPDATMFYMSWNGATEVRQWRLYGRQNCSSEWTELDTVPWDNFETVANVTGYWAYGLVEALDGEGKPLRRSTTNGVRTFVPTDGKMPTDVLGERLKVFEEQLDHCHFTPLESPSRPLLEKLGMHHHVWGSITLGSILLLVIALLMSGGLVLAAFRVWKRYYLRPTHSLLPQSDPELDGLIIEHAKSERS